MSASVKPTGTRFVARELTPRFPDGLTIIDAIGQWRDRDNGRIVREPSKHVEIVLPGNDDDEARLDAVVAAYKHAFHQQSVGVIVRTGLRLVLASPQSPRLVRARGACGRRATFLASNDGNAVTRKRAAHDVCPDELKLVALDRDDIEVVSAHVQDALVQVGEIFWLPRTIIASSWRSTASIG